MSVAYLSRRLSQVLPLLLAISAAVFMILRLIPGDPAQIFLGQRATPEGVEQLRHQWGLDRPLFAQYASFVTRAARGDLGNSVVYDRPVTSLIAERLPATLALVGYAGVLTVALTGPLALLAALQRDRLADQVIRGIFSVALAMPGFWLGTMFILVFGLRLGWFPIAGYGGGLGRLWHLFLPAFTIALSTAALLVRNLRTAILDVIRADYVRTAQAKGVPHRRVLVRHVARNALLSTITLLGARLGWLIGSSVIIEAVFAIPGIGSLMVGAIYGRDYPIIQGMTLVFATLVVLISLATDIVYTLLDPRVAYE
jgi:peptide/nickel transport system permease protein